MLKPNMTSSSLLSIIYLLTLFMFACSGGDSGQQDMDASGAQEESSDTMAMNDDIRTINIIGIDDMKFAVEQEMEGITVGQSTGAQGGLLLLETIEAEPGEEIRIRLTTRSQLPPSAMSHNWVLMTADADPTVYVRQAQQAQEQDYLPPALSDMVLAHTEMVGGGETTEIVFTAPETPGEYEYLCSFPGHYAAGMKGFLIVLDNESDTATE